ncbi:MAG: hypothetical protein WC342_07165 [Methanoregula sp.]|jgi:hypothetical protein
MGDPGNLSPCAADALFGTRWITVAGKTVGTAGFETAVAAVRARGIAGGSSIKAELLRRVREENYIPPALEDNYAAALLTESPKIFSAEKP